MNGHQQYRLRFIDFLLGRFGTIRRADIVDYFGLSTPQASIDIAAYMAAAPGNVEYDKSAKVYRATPGFTRRFP
jgi:hypothetical protein